jgi:hypothetical protein
LAFSNLTCTATSGTRFYFPSAEQPNGGGNPMLRHFDVFTSDVASVATGTPTELHSTKAFYGDSVPAGGCTS